MNEAQSYRRLHSVNLTAHFVNNHIVTNIYLKIYLECNLSSPSCVSKMPSRFDSVFKFRPALSEWKQIHVNKEILLINPSFPYNTVSPFDQTVSTIVTQPHSHQYDHMFSRWLYTEDFEKRSRHLPKSLSTKTLRPRAINENIYHFQNLSIVSSPTKSKLSWFPNREV